MWLLRASDFNYFYDRLDVIMTNQPPCDLSFLSFLSFVDLEFVYQQYRNRELGRNAGEKSNLLTGVFSPYTGTQPTSMWKRNYGTAIPYPGSRIIIILAGAWVGNWRWQWNGHRMETLLGHLHCHLSNYNLRKVNCDPLRKIKRPIGYILLEEICAIVLAPLGHEPPGC